MTERIKQERGRIQADEARLRWALWFAQEDLRKWRDGDWLNALDDAAKLAYETEQLPSYAWWQGKSVEDAKAWLTPLREALGDFFKKVHKGKDAEVPGEVSCVFVTLDRPRRLQVHYKVSVQESSKRPEGFITKSLLQVGDVLTRIKLSRLNECPECRRLFLAVRRQRFDTLECSLRDRKRRFYEKSRKGRSRK